MWLKLLLFCSLGVFAYTNHSPAWKYNHEYSYHVRGRLLTGLNQVSNKYSGILLRAKLTIRPTQDGHLKGKLSGVEYANIQKSLDDNWEQPIPDSEASYEDIHMGSKPFKIVMRDGVVDDLVVDESLSNWQANMIKGVVSQLQLDTKGERQIRSFINIFTQDTSNTAVFKTMEETVTGESETLYDIHPFPEHVVQSEPWLAPLKDRNPSEDLIEVVKNKNFTHSKESPSYHFGFEGVDDFDVKNQIGEFLSRTSVTRVILSGSLKSFTIQSAVTVDQVTVNPNLGDKQRGLTASMVNLTLASINQENHQFEYIPQPVNVGLVYRYDQPFDKSNRPRPKTHSSGNESREPKVKQSDASSESDGSDSEIHLHVEDNKPRIHEAPASPLLPLTTGYDGRAISMKQNIKEDVRALAMRIGKEFQQPQSILEQDTVGKFLLLTSAVRVMNHEEMKQVADELYTQEEKGATADAWVAYRDAVAQAGTGPALLCIEEWIRSDRVSGHEAAEIVATAADSARQPTEKYMQVFFAMIKDAEIMEKQQLNESLVLSFTRLSHKVYVDRKGSHDNYPVHSFGTFNSAQARLFVRNQVIPHLSSKLNEAVSQADTKKIHLYIRALGNVGDQQILQTFKPYLEGAKKASQFQRILMVMALDELIRSNPKVARSVLYKIYRNPRDFQQVRVAAVYQLIRSGPAPAMLQRMASYTNIDTNSHVNSAVKSAIQEAANLQVPRLAKIRAAAQSALPFLTSKDFGVQNSKVFLQNYMVEQMRMEVKQVAASFGGEDGLFPKGFSYVLRGRLGGLKRHVLTVQSMLSSVQDLIDVWQQQSKQYRELLKEKQSHQCAGTRWCSEYAAQRLNLRSEQRERLEGYTFMHIGAFQKIWSFDDHTIENLTDVVRHLEEELKKGVYVHYRKMSVDSQMAVAFPTAWGLPFIYTYDRPTLVHIKNIVSAISRPSLHSTEGIQRPEAIHLGYNFRAFISGRTQGQFGFFAPFNHKRYSAGYDKNFQISVPGISGKVHIDVQNKQTTLEVSKFDRDDVNLVHFSTCPYISQDDIFALQPKKHIIRRDDDLRRKVNTIVGEESTGIAFSLDINSDRDIDYGSLYQRLLQKDSLPAVLLGPWVDDDIQHVEINVGIDRSKTTTNRVLLHLGHQGKYVPGLKNLRNILEKISHPGVVAAKSWTRQNEFLTNTSTGISNVYTRVIDAALVFDGQEKIKYTATASGARSDDDPKGRVLVQAEKYLRGHKVLKLVIASESNTPDPPTLDADSALEFDPKTVIEIKGKLERREKPKPAEFNLKVELSQSEERRRYLKKQEQYRECQRQMQQGNNQLPACESMTVQANLLDQFSVTGDYQNVDLPFLSHVYRVYSAFRHHSYSRISENLIVHDHMHSQNRFSVEGNYSSDLAAVNASVNTEYGRIEISDVPVDGLARSILVSHPAYDVGTRLVGHVLKHHAYHATCIVDKNAVNTLDNKTYAASLSKDWVIVLHYVPRSPSPIRSQPDLPVASQLNHHLEGYIVYARAAEQDNSQKEIKMVIQSANTLGKVIDVTLKPSISSGGYPRLFVQNEQVIYDDRGSHIYDDYMQVYKLPDGELKVKVYGSFDLVYDGVRAKLAVLDDKFRDSARGLCGTFTGEPETDFTHPGNCIVSHPDEFVARNTIPDTERIDMVMIQPNDDKCLKKDIGYVDVVSDRDSGFVGEDSYSVRKLRTKYISVDGKLCFSLQPLLFCPPETYQVGEVSKSVQVQCVKPSHNDLWVQDISEGTKIDLGDVKETRFVTMTLPEKCVEYQ